MDRHNDIPIIDTDVLVVGGGAAGTRAALAAGEEEVKVLLVDSARVGRDGATNFTTKAEGAWGVQASLGDIPEDSPEEHYNEVIQAAQGMCRAELVRVLVEEGPSRIQELIDWGLPFEKTRDGSLVREKGCFSKKRRAVTARSPHTISRFLFHIIRERFPGSTAPLRSGSVSNTIGNGITILNGVQAYALVVDGGRCFGAVIYDKKAGCYFSVAAKTVILATGGTGQLFRYNVNPAEIDGNGLALACRAGAEVTNIEFVQIGIGFVRPVEQLHVPRHVWLLEPQLSDSRGNDILSPVLPKTVGRTDVYMARSEHFPFSCSDESRYIDIAIASTTAIQRPAIHDFPKLANESVGGVFMRLDAGVEKNIPDHYCSCHLSLQRLRERGIYLNSDNLQLAHYFHALNGGLLVDENGKVAGFENLYAAGEVADGVHGADRLGGNMLLATQVFGRRSGITAALETRTGSLTSEAIKGKANYLTTQWKRHETPFQGLPQDHLQKLVGELKQASTRALLVGREENKLLAYRKRCEQWEREIIQEAKPCTASGHAATIALYNMLLVGRILTAAALERRESRGSHYRTDFPEKDQFYDDSTVFTFRSGEIVTV